MKTINKQIGLRLKALRQDKNWSLDKTAEHTTVSKAMLGQIERGESSPTIATLWKIASGFHVSFSSFFEGGTPGKKLKKINFNSDENIQVTTLFPFDKQLRCEIFAIAILPGREHLSSAHETGVIEHIIVVSGTLEVFLEGDWHVLKKGQGLCFNADQPHGYRNCSTREVCFHNIIHYV